MSASYLKLKPLTMGYKIILLALAVLMCKVQSQRCSCAGPAPGIISAPILPPQVPIPQVTTTIVDNSVSNALANALQLLIVSDLIESALGPAIVSNLLNKPVVETLAAPYCGPVIKQEYITPCRPSVEVLQPCGAPMVESIAPNVFGGYTESFSPLYGPGAPFVERIRPNIYGGVTETISPLYRSGPIVEKFQPNICGGIETYGPGAVIEKIQPNVFGGLTETLSSLYGPQIVEQFLPNGFGITETISPNYCGGVTEVITQNPFFNGLTEVISPMSPVINPNYYGGITEVVTPSAQFVPNYYGGVTEILSSPPMAAEVMFPSSIPAQLTCNFGYNVPANTPCVNFNVEPLPFEPCNNFGNTFYY